LSSIYLYIAVQKCHIRGKRDNNGEKIAQKEIAKLHLFLLEETSTPGKNQRPFITLTNFYHIKMYHH
jgi:hypothetical protein